LNSKVLALIWDYFCFILITLFIMARQDFHLKLKLLLDHLFTQERNAVIAFPFRMGTVVLEYPTGNVKRGHAFF
jgi:hypothetical protein